METALATLIALVVTAGSVLLAAAVFVLPTLLFGVGVLAVLWLVKRANDPDPAHQLPKPVHDYLHYESKVLKGHDPQHDAWQAAADQLGLRRTERPETWTSYGSSVLEGTLDGRAVHVSVRERVNLRYTVATVAVEPDFVPPADLHPVLTRPTKQGRAFVSHPPTLEVQGERLVHTAIGIRDDPDELAALVRALVTTAAC